MLTVLVSKISHSHIFLLKNVNSFCKSYCHFFSKNFKAYAIFHDQSFNDTLTNDVVSFEQLGPDIYPHVSDGDIVNVPICLTDWPSVHHAIT